MEFEMEIKPARKVHYTVERSGSGLWQVTQRDFVRTIASFSSKRDALEYAQRLAARADDAEVTVS